MVPGSSLLMLRHSILLQVFPKAYESVVQTGPSSWSRPIQLSQGILEGCLWRPRARGEAPYSRAGMCSVHFISGR